MDHKKDRRMTKTTTSNFFPDDFNEYWIIGLKRYKGKDYISHIPDGWNDPEKPLWHDGFLGSYLVPIHAVGFASLHAQKWLSKVRKGNNRFLKMEINKESAYWLREFFNIQKIFKVLVKRTEDERGSTSCSLILNEEIGKGNYAVHLGVDPIEESVSAMSSSKKGGGVVTIYMDVDKDTGKGMQSVPDELYNFNLVIAPALKNQFPDELLNRIDFTNIKLLAGIITECAGKGSEGKKVVVLMRDRHSDLIRELIEAGIRVEQKNFQKMKENVKKSEKGIYENGNIILIEHGDLSAGLGLVSGKAGIIVGAGRATEGAALANLTKCIGGKYRGRLCNEKLSYNFSEFERSLMKRCGIVESGSEKGDQIAWDKIFTENDLCGKGDIVFYYGAVRDNYWMEDLKGAYVLTETGDGVANIFRVTRSGMPRIFTVHYKTRISKLNKELAGLKKKLKRSEDVLYRWMNAYSDTAYDFINEYEIKRGTTNKKSCSKTSDFSLIHLGNTVSRRYLARYRRRIRLRIGNLEKIKEMLNHAMALIYYHRAKAYDEFGLFDYAIMDIHEARRIVSFYNSFDKESIEKYKKADAFFRGMKFLATSKGSFTAYMNAIKKFSLALDHQATRTIGLINPADMMKKIGFFILNFEKPFLYPSGKDCEAKSFSKDVKNAGLFYKFCKRLEALYKDFSPINNRDKAGYNLLIEHKKHLEWFLGYDKNGPIEAMDQEFYAHCGESFSRMANEYYNLGYNLLAIDFFRKSIKCFERIPFVYRGYYLPYAKLRVAQCYEKIGFDSEAIEEYYKLLDPKEDIISGVGSIEIEDRIFARFSALFKALLPALRGYVIKVMRKHGASEDEIKNAINKIVKESKGCHDVYINEDGVIFIVFDSGEDYQRKKKIYLKELEREALIRKTS